MLSRVLFFFFLICGLNHVFCQQPELSPLRYNPVLFNEDTLFKNQYTSGNFIYEITPISLPFVDDFSKNRQKQYFPNAVYYWYDFAVDSVYQDSLHKLLYPDSLGACTTQTYIQYFTNDTIGSPDSTIATDTLRVIIYADPGTIIDTLKRFPLGQKHITNTTTVYYDSTQIDTSLFNNGYPYVIAIDPNETNDKNYVQLIDSIKYSFSLNGLYPNQYDCMSDTSYHTTINYTTIPPSFSYQATNPILVLNYNGNEDELFLPTDTTLVWPNSVNYTLITNNGSTTFTNVLNPNLTLTQSEQTYYYVKDDNSLWIDPEKKQRVFINRNWAIDPITIGVATFDGLDETGQPYDFSSSLAHGIADYLTSKPIDLSNYNNQDSVFLSFYYQPQGHGDIPNDNDSLVLEFYNMEDNSWKRIWSAEGKSNQPFQEVFVEVADSIYFTNEFQFRFKNYASLSGSFDHWHLDYVYLDQGRSPNVNAKDDFGLQKIDNSFIEKYTSMPYQHYMSNPSKYTKDSVDLTLVNLQNAVVNNDFNNYLVYENEGLIFTANFENNNTGFPANSTSDIYFTVDYPTQNNYVFPSSSSLLRREFKIVWATSTFQGTGLLNDNDTVFSKQNFDTYYAYDDGTAERGFSFPATGAKVAYEYTIDQNDSLRGIWIFFPKMLDDISTHSIMLKVWNQNGTVPTNTPIAQFPVNPTYTNHNELHRFELDEPIAIAAGSTFYIGWEQFTDDPIHVGFDKNIDTHDKVFYRTSGTWTQLQSSTSGSLMMRPDFGSAKPASIHNQLQKNRFSAAIYPNPASNKITIDLNGNDQISTINIVLTDIHGRIVFHTTSNSTKTEIEISEIPIGMYLVRIANQQTGDAVVKKLIIAN